MTIVKILSLTPTRCMFRYDRPVFRLEVGIKEQRRLKKDHGGYGPKRSNAIEEDGEEEEEEEEEEKEKEKEEEKETLNFDVTLGYHLVPVLHTSQTHNCFPKPSLMIRFDITLYQAYVFQMNHITRFPSEFLYAFLYT